MNADPYAFGAGHRRRFSGLAGVAGCVALLGGVCGHGALGQEYRVQNWHVEDGLPSGEITAIQQTPDGYLWIGTPKGLARFDGARFKVFRASPGYALTDLRIGCLLTSHDGTLWISTQDGNVVRRHEGKFDQAQPPVKFALDQKDNRAPGNWLWARRNDIMKGGEEARDEDLLNGQSQLVEDREGAIAWRASSVKVMRLKSGRWTVFTPTNGLPVGRAQQLAVDHEGHVWLEAGGKLHRYDSDGWDSHQEAVPLSGPWPVLAPANQGGLWVAEPRGSWFVNGGQLRRFADGQWHNDRQPIPVIPHTAQSMITCLMEDHTRRVWYGTASGGVFYAGPAGAWQRLNPHTPFSQGYISCLFEDAQGDIWVGTVGDGLYRVTPQPLTMSMLILPPPMERAQINTTCVAHDGAIWIGTGGSGVLRWYSKSNFTTFGAAQGFNNLHVCAIFEDSQTNVWAGTMDRLSQLKSGHFEQVEGLPELTWVKAILEDRAGRLWIGSDEGLICRQKEQFTLYNLLADRSYCDIRSIAEDAQGDIWIGTVGQGLFRLPHGQPDRIHRVNEFPAMDPRALCCDQEGTLWVGSWGNGLFRRHENTFTAFSTEDGLPSDRIQSIVNDAEGRIWLSTDNGIVELAPRTLKNYERGHSPPLWCQHFSLAEGLANRGCSGSGQPVCAQTRDGRLWFPDYEGIAVLDPRAVTTQPLAPAVLVEAVLAEGKELAPAQNGELRVTSNVRRYEFDYTSPDLVMPQNLCFRYKLDGIDHDWVEAGAQRVAYYSQLKPGQYQFRVAIGGSDGQWHGTDQKVYLRVMPRLWERSWIQVLAGGLLIAVLGGGMAWGQRRKFRLQMERLEMQQAVETERRRIARDLHDELGARLTATALQGEFVVQRGGIPDHAKSEMSNITHRIRELIGTVDEVVWTTDPENDSLSSMVPFLCDYVEQFLTQTGVGFRLEVSSNLPNLPLAAQVRRNLLLAVKEALSNGVRYAHARIIQLKICAENGWLNVEVSDDGRGFELAKTRANSKGLSNIRSRMELVKGKAEIRSESGKGTTVALSVRLSGNNVRKQ